MWIVTLLATGAWLLCTPGAPRGFEAGFFTDGASRMAIATFGSN